MVYIYKTGKESAWVVHIDSIDVHLWNKKKFTITICWNVWNTPNIRIAQHLNWDQNEGQELFNSIIENKKAKFEEV